MGRIKKYQEVQGVITVEMAYLMPIIFMVFVLVVYTAFYYHDKQILIGAAAETTTVGAQQKRWPGESVAAEQFCRERIGGKLILFAETEVTTSVTKEWVRRYLCKKEENETSYQAKSTGCQSGKED